MVISGELTTLLSRSPRDNRPGLEPQKRLSPEEVAQLVRDYANGEGSIYGLADRYGIHRQTVAHHLKAHGLELGRTSLSPEEATRARDLARLGWSANRIGVQLQRDPKTIRTLLASRGMLQKIPLDPSD